MNLQQDAERNGRERNDLFRREISLLFFPPQTLIDINASPPPPFLKAP